MCLSVLFPFIRTGMTNEYAENERVFGRWQPRMLETHECATAFAQLLARPTGETDLGCSSSSSTRSTRATLTGSDFSGNRVRLDVTEHDLDWSQHGALEY